MLTGWPVGPVAVTGTRVKPAATAASTVPSPPSATGIVISSACAQARSRASRNPAARAAATSAAGSDPLNLSGAITIRMPLVQHDHGGGGQAGRWPGPARRARGSQARLASVLVVGWYSRLTQPR